MPQMSLHSPVGDLTLFAEDGALVAVEWGWVERQDESSLLAAARRQLEDYFDRRGLTFDLPLAPAGTAFQKRAWRHLSQIPPGRTQTYGEVARALGSSPRAVGMACAANPIPIVVPCHRIVAAGGKPGGYSGNGGLDTKVALLRLEGIDV